MQKKYTIIYETTMLMTRGLLRIATCVVVFCLFISCQHSSLPLYQFKLGHLANESHTWHKAALYLDSILNIRTEGAVRVQVFPNEQLGKEVDMIRSIRSGIADMTITAGTLQNWTEVAAFTDMPFLLRDTAHLTRLAKSSIGSLIKQRILENAGLQVLCYFQRGPRQLTSNRPIREPGDLQGLILRTPNVPSYVTVWQALGAKPTPMAFSEVFTALQQGTIEAEENPLAMVKSAHFAEVQKYVNLTGHVISWVYVVIGERQFNAMPEKYQKIFLEAARDMQRYEHQLFMTQQKQLQAELEAQGMQFISVHRAAFEKIASEAIFNNLDDEMKTIYLQIKSL